MTSIPRSRARSQAPWTRLAAVVVAGALAVACSSSRAADHPPTRQLTLVGDSLSVLGADPITSALAQSGWTTTIDAYPGVTTEDQLPAIGRAAQTSSDAVVVELGTNDALAIARGLADAADEPAHLAAALDRLGPRCVVWVNVDADPARPGGPGGAIVNAALAAEAARRPTLRIADLGALLASHPQYLLDDQVHLTSEGSAALGQLVASKVATCS